jgi:hypothetical protein
MCDSCYEEHRIGGTNLELNTGSNDKDIPVSLEFNGGRIAQQLKYLKASVTSVFFTLNITNWLKLQYIYSDTYLFTLPLIRHLFNDTTVSYEVQIIHIASNDRRARHCYLLIALPERGCSER